MKGFLEIERASMERNVGRANSALDDALDAMKTKSGDWSYWDDTYEFVKSLDPDFIASNLQPEAFESLEVNLVLLFDPKGELRYGRAHASGGESLEKVGTELLRSITEQRELFTFPELTTAHTGIVMTPRGPLLVVSRQILRSDNTGPSRGTFLFGRFLDAPAVERLSNLAHLPVSVYPFVKGTLPEDVIAEGRESLRTGKPVIVAKDEEQIHGYSVVRAIGGEPALLIKVEARREIFAQAKSTKNSLFEALLLSGAVFGIVILALLERSVLSRIARVGRTLTLIQRERNLERRIPDEGRDEIGVLAREINSMLESLAFGQLEVIAARDIAEAASLAKSQFVANISHEVRTPLNGILGMAEAALREELPHRVRESLRVIRESGNYLLAIVNDVLDFSKVEAGKLTIDPVHFRLAPLLDSTLQILKVRADEKNLSVQAEIDPEIPPVVHSDPVRLRQVITNLVGNALKFTDSGGVLVRLSAGKMSRFGCLLTFSVQDTGIGIPAEKLDRVFEAFTQADGSTTRKYGGTGLGLTIAKQIVEAMGGSISVASTFGEGSTFTFTILVGAGDPALVEEDDGVKQRAIPRAARPLTVLVADDVRANQLVAQRLLEASGHTVEVVGDGRQAVEVSSCKRFDAILMDVHMPVMDGIEATRLIRERENPSDRIPIVALTANVSQDEAERARGVGVSAFAEKPLNIEHLLKLLDSLTGGVQDIATDQNAIEPKRGVLPFDWEGLLERFGGDEEIAREIVTEFLGEVDGLYGALRQAMETGDAAAIRNAAHALKGGCINAGGLAAGALAREIEDAARTGLGARSEWGLKLRDLLNAFREEACSIVGATPSSSSICD